MSGFNNRTIKFKVPYSKVEDSFVDPLELACHPEKFLILSLETVINCKRCRKRLTIKKNDNNVTFLCGCGCRIIYPRNKNGEFVSNFITKEEHLAGLNKNGNGE